MWCLVKIMAGILFLILFTFGAAIGAEMAFAPRMPDSSQYAQGRFVYERNCLICHGRWGDGKGEMGKETIPPPRNFGTGVFKYKRTPVGKLPSNDDLQRTVRNGLSGTAMPAFSQLSEREIESVVEYVKTFSGKWRHTTNYAAAVELPPLPKWFKDKKELEVRAQKGRELFQTLCASCHGADGSGRGAITVELIDSWGQPVKPTDLRVSQLRSGERLEDVFRVLHTGIEATPMPSFAEALSEESRWELVAYIQKLRTKEQ